MPLPGMVMSASSNTEFLAKYVLGRFGEPAFARRARAIEDAYEALLAKCRRRREDLLRHVRRAQIASRPREIAATVRRFNFAWARFLQALDLSPINNLRAGYNRYYVLEKECALHSAKLAEVGFRPLPPLTHAELAALFPPLTGETP